MESGLKCLSSIFKPASKKDIGYWNIFHDWSSSAIMVQFPSTSPSLLFVHVPREKWEFYFERLVNKGLKGSAQRHYLPLFPRPGLIYENIYSWGFLRQNPTPLKTNLLTSFAWKYHQQKIATSRLLDDKDLVAKLQKGIDKHKLDSGFLVWAGTFGFILNTALSASDAGTRWWRKRYLGGAAVKKV